MTTAISKRRYEAVLLLVVDALFLMGAQVVTEARWPRGWIVVPAVLVVLAAGHFYHPRLTMRPLDDLPALLVATVTTVGFLGVLDERSIIGSVAVVQALLAGAALVAARAVSYTLILAGRRKGLLHDRVLIVGAGRLGCELAMALRSRPKHGLTPVAIADSSPPVNSLIGPLTFVDSSSEGLDDLIAELGVQHLIVAFGRNGDEDWLRLMRAAAVNDIAVHAVPRFFDLGSASRGRRGTDEVWGVPLVWVRRGAMRRLALTVKRAIDILFAGVVLLITAPVQVIVALAVRLQDGGPILYRQVRVGQHGRTFEVLKFRSMPMAHDGQTTWSADSQATRIGYWLRRTSIDELPQLWNILRGDMSIVGPRPERPLFAEQFEQTIPGYADRHRLPVGLTGWAQVSGLRGDTSIVERARFDNYYIEHWSVWFDCKIMLRTAWAVFQDLLSAIRSPA